MSKYSHLAEIQEELSRPTQSPKKTVTFYALDEYTEKLYFEESFQFTDPDVPGVDEQLWDKYLVWVFGNRQELKELMESKDYGELKYMIHCNDPEMEKTLRARQKKEMLISRKKC